MAAQLEASLAHHPKRGALLFALLLHVCLLPPQGHVFRVMFKAERVASPPTIPTSPQAHPTIQTHVTP